MQHLAYNYDHMTARCIDYLIQTHLTLDSEICLLTMATEQISLLQQQLLCCKLNCFDLPILAEC